MRETHLRAGLLTVLAAWGWSFLLLTAVPALAEDRRADDDPFAAPAAEPGDPVAAVAAPETNAGERRPARPPAANDRELEQRIQTALDSTTLMEFIDTPLQDAVDYLKDLHGIEIQLDNKALEEAGVGSDTPVTRTLKGLSLRSSLQLMLEPLELVFFVRHGVLEITTHQAASKMIELRVYNVRQLIGDALEIDDVAEVARLALVRQGAGRVRGGAPVEAPPKVRPATEEDEAIIVPFGELLVVRGSLAEHERLADLLEKIQEKLPQGK